MDLLEYQGKGLLADFGVPTPQGEVCSEAEGVVRCAASLGFPVVLKAQVPVGGRGKAGGVRVVSSETEARSAAQEMLGMKLKGHIVRELWVEHGCDIDSEWYVSFTLDRSARKYLGMLSDKGGMDIEEVAGSHPEAISRVHIDPLHELTEQTAADWISKAKLCDRRGRPIGEEISQKLVAVLRRLFRVFVEADAELVEVNPLVLDASGALVALDAKVSLDANAGFRHPEWADLAGAAYAGSDPREALARSKGLQYVGLEGTVGIIANGAGLAMSSLDVVSQCGGAAANFLDIGGGASSAVMASALEVIMSDSNVASIFVNIFGGITRCDEVARGILGALQRVQLSTPIVLRLDGTNAREGRELLASQPHPLVFSEPTMLEAAAKAVEFASAGSGRIA